MTPGKPYIGAQVWYNEEKTAYYTVIEVGATHFKAIDSRIGSSAHVWNNHHFLHLKYGESPKYSTIDLLKALKNEITGPGN